MKTIKLLLTLGILFTATITVQANDSYPLFNDMKMAKKEQFLLKNMQALISDHKNNNKSKLREQKKIFEVIITGLSNGNSKLKLQGTKLSVLKNKIMTIQLLWSQEKNILDSAMNNKMYKSDAYVTLKKLSKEIAELNKLYKKSYVRYKQNTKMKSLVSSYMKKHTQSEPMYALNVVK